MLLLSSATKILATERPPGDTATAPHTIAQLYWSIGSHMRQRELEACVSEGEYRAAVRMPCNQRKSGHLPAFSSQSEVFPSTLPGHYFLEPLLLLAARFLLGILLVIRVLRSICLIRVRGLRIAARRIRRLRWLFASGSAGRLCSRRRRGCPTGSFRTCPCRTGRRSRSLGWCRTFRGCRRRAITRKRPD